MKALPAICCAVIFALKASGTILLNEIQVNPPGEPDHNFEYIELRSSTNGPEPLTGLTLLIIDNNGAQIGEVEEALNLSNYSTGANGLLLIGNGYDGSPPAGPWSGFRFSATQTADPSGIPPFSSLGDANIGPNGGVTFLLVSDWTGLTNATTSSLGDVDVNNNSILDWLESSKPPGSQIAQPYGSLVDSVGFRDLANVPARLPYTPADVNARSTNPATFAPDNLSRLLSRTAVPIDQNNPNAWYGGNLSGTTGLAIEYDVQFFGDFRGRATPGQDNLAAAPSLASILINEVSINPPGENDENFEYIELINASPAGGAASLHGLALLLIRSNDAAGTDALGVIREAWDLSPYSTGQNGLLLLGNGYASSNNPWGEFVEVGTQLGDPEAPTAQNPVVWSSLGDSDLGTNDGFTILLVQNFTGSVGQDLDANNDGTLDTKPWSLIKDSVGIDQLAPGIGKSYSQGKVSTLQPYDIDNISRKKGVTAPNSSTAWYGGGYGGTSQFSIAFEDSKSRPVLGGFRGAATPGRINLDAAPSPAPIRISEIQIDPVSTSDRTYEYVELINENLTLGTMNGLTLVLAEGRPGAQNGRILESVDLSPLSTGPNGLVLLGDEYDQNSPYDSPLRQTSPLTALEDPPGLESADAIGPNTGLIVLIARGVKPIVGENVSTIPTSDILDSIGIGTSTSSVIAMMNAEFTPHNVSRYPGDFRANAANAWFGGQLDPAMGDESLLFTNKFSGSYKGAASPGRYNHAAPTDSSVTLLLNEINIDPPGADGNFEFVEYRAFPPLSISTNGYTLLLLDGAGDNVGTILEAWSLDGLSTGTNGLLLTGAGYPKNQPWLGTNSPASATHLGSPSGMAPADIAGSSNGGAVTLLLVKNFTGRIGQDLDMGTGSPVVGADDGVNEVTPWTTPVADAVGLRFWDETLQPPALSGRLYTPTDLSQSGYTPDNLSRLSSNTIAGATAAWFGGEITGTSGTSITLDFARRFPGNSSVGIITPGRPNTPLNSEDDADPDADGMTNLLELALNMNPAIADSHRLPRIGSIDISGTAFPTLAYSRFIGGVQNGQNYAANGFSYEPQVSTDLNSWTGSVEPISTVPNGDGLTETAVVRPLTAYLDDAVRRGAPIFLRLKIRRL